VKAARRKPGRTWHLDEMFVTLRGEAHLLWRAVDERGAELDILIEKRRDKAAAKRFFKRVLRSKPVPSKIVTDQLRSYPAVKAEIPALAGVKHVPVKTAARLNNRAENSHQPMRERKRRIPKGGFLRGVRGFRTSKRTQQFLSCIGPIRQHFALKLLVAGDSRREILDLLACCCSKQCRRNGGFGCSENCTDAPTQFYIERISKAPNNRLASHRRAYKRCGHKHHHRLLHSRDLQYLLFLLNRMHRP